MRKEIFIWHVLRVMALPKLLYYRVFFATAFPIGSIICGFPKIRDGNKMQFKKGFQLWRLCRLNGYISTWENFFMNEFWTISAGSQKKSRICFWDNVMIWPLFYAISQDHWFSKWEIFNVSQWKGSEIVIWNNVWIGARVTILKWVNIWDNVVIWAWSVVTKDIPANTIAVWNPCAPKKQI